MIVSRRTFTKTLLCTLPMTVASFPLSPGLLAAVQPAATGMLPLGLNTWSLRALKHDQAIPTIIRFMKQADLHNCQLLFSHAEPEEFDPDFAAMSKTPSPEQRIEQKRKSEARAAWRRSVPMTYFENLRAQFSRQNLAIRSYATPLGSAAEEIDRVFLMAKTLGAGMVITRLTEAQTDLAAAAATRHGLLVGIQFSDPGTLTQQLKASPRFRADPDIGDLTKAGVSALDFIKEHLDSISSVDLKDAVSGGGSVPFGTGEAHIRQVIKFLLSVRSQVELYIDCDYPGTGTSTDEVNRCVTYVRQVKSGS